MTDSTRQVLDALIAKGYEVLYHEGRFAIKGQGVISLAQARKLTGIQAPKREYRPRALAWGDWATVAMFNRQRI